MKIEAELSTRAHDEKIVELANNVSAVRVVLTTPRDVADSKRVKVGGAIESFRSLD